MQKRFTKKSKLLVLLFGFLLTASPAFSISPVISWSMDMNNQPSVKSQGEGTFQTFPEGSVTRSGIVINSNGLQNTEAATGIWLGMRNDPATAPANPVKADDASVANGEYLYNVYCAACHGEDGNAQTTIGTQRGAPPIAAIVGADPTLQDGYLYYKIKYGGVVIESMPSFGFETSSKDRWDIVNYLNKKWRSANSQ